MPLCDEERGDNICNIYRITDYSPQSPVTSHHCPGGHTALAPLLGPARLIRHKSGGTNEQQYLSARFCKCAILFIVTCN